MRKLPTAPKPSVYQTVTDRIIASLKAGVIPWEKPWQSPRFSGGPFPRNFRTGKPYRGINIMLLWACDFSSPFWLTFNQAKELNGSVRKGEKGTQIVFYKQLTDSEEKNDEQTDEAERRASFVLTYHTVFNVEQCDGLTLPEIEQPIRPNDVEIDDTCEAIVGGWSNRPSLHLTSETEFRAYYRPSTDSVHMPARARFVDAPHYYSTLFHELIHSTGHESRLNRTFGAHFGDDLYGKEELVAEMGAAFLCAIAGIANENTERNTTAYIQNWISKLEDDNRLIFHAAANAQRAVDSILGISFQSERVEETRFLLGRVNRIEYKLLMVRQAVHPPYRYWIETARLRWIARGECPNARRNDRRMRSRFPKPFFLAISSAEKRPVSIIKRADSTRSCWIA